MATTHEEASHSIVTVALVCRAMDLGCRGARYGLYALALGYRLDGCSLKMSDSCDQERLCRRELWLQGV